MDLIPLLALIFFILLAVFNLLGLIGLSRFSFGAVNEGNHMCIRMTPTQHWFTQVYIVLAWLALILAIVFGLKAGSIAQSLSASPANPLYNINPAMTGLTNPAHFSF